MLLLRAGVGPAQALSRRQVARRLKLPVAQVRRIEVRGLRRLTALGRSGRCAAVATAASGSGGRSLLGLPVAFTTPAADERAGSGPGDARSGVKGVSRHGSRDRSDPVIPPALAARSTPLMLVLVLAITLVALAVLLRRELPPRRR